MDDSNLSPHQSNTSRHVRPASYSKTSSASCSNAKANEDWTKMADLAERRRVQNRIAQRNYRQKLKKRLERAGELERRASSTSPPSTNALLAGSLSSPETRDRSRSTGAAVTPNFVPPPPMRLYQELFPEQYDSVHGDPFPAVSEGYLKQPTTPAPVPFSFLGYNQPVPASYPGYHQNSTFTDLPSISGPYLNPMHQGQYAVDGSSITTTSGPPITPVTPSSQRDCYPVNDRPSYPIDFTHTYDNAQMPTTLPYTDSATSVNLSDFFTPNYPSS